MLTRLVALGLAATCLSGCTRSCTMMGALNSFHADLSAVTRLDGKQVTSVTMCLEGDCGPPMPIRAGRERSVPLFDAEFLVEGTPVPVELRLHDASGKVLQAAKGQVSGVPRVVHPNGPGCGTDTVLVARVRVDRSGSSLQQIHYT